MPTGSWVRLPLHGPGLCAGRFPWITPWGGEGRSARGCLGHEAGVVTAPHSLHPPPSEKVPQQALPTARPGGAGGAAGDLDLLLPRSELNFLLGSMKGLGLRPREPPVLPCYYLNYVLSAGGTAGHPSQHEWLCVLISALLRRLSEQTSQSDFHLPGSELHGVAGNYLRLGTAFMTMQ